MAFLSRLWCQSTWHHPPREQKSLFIRLTLQLGARRPPSTLSLSVLTINSSAFFLDRWKNEWILGGFFNKRGQCLPIQGIHILLRSSYMYIRALETRSIPIERLFSLARHRDLLSSTEREKSCYVADPRATRQKSNFGKYSKHEKCHRWGRGERMEFPFVSLSRNTWDGIIIAPSAHPKIYFSRDHPTFLFQDSCCLWIFFIVGLKK